MSCYYIRTKVSVLLSNRLHKIAFFSFHMHFDTIRQVTVFDPRRGNVSVMRAVALDSLGNEILAFDLTHFLKK